MSVTKINTILLAAGATFIAISMILFPDQSFNASLNGLKMWWEVVFPSLFPFFVISELLISFGVVTFMGVLLEPLMRPLFKVPGVGGFVWAMGMASGFPAGAKFTSRLRQEKHLTKTEAERLVSFTNSSSPLFIFGAVSVGFFHNPRLGFLLAFAHYLGNFCVGLIMRFYKKGDRIHTRTKTKLFVNVKQAFSELHKTRMKNRKPFGKLLGDAIISSIQTLLMIGGFIILFSVLNKLLNHLEITTILAVITNFFLSLFQLPTELSFSLIAGIFEITLGNQLTSQVQVASLMQKAIVSSFILGFTGLCVQAQVGSILAETDIRFKPFFVARIIHGFLAALFTFIFWKPFANHFDIQAEQTVVPVDFKGYDEWWERLMEFFIQIGPLFTISSLIVYIFLYVNRMGLTKQ